MIPLNKFGSKLKKVTENAIQMKVNHALFGASLMAVLWVCSLDAGPSCVPKHLREYIQFPEHYEVPEKQFNETELRKLLFKVENLNSQAEVINGDKCRPVQSETTVIVILVHKDVARLQYLIMSLGQVRYIWRVLLIFSHSYFDEEINNLVTSIKFCRVLQIFYPNSLQLYPNEFPGVDPDDCNATLPTSPAPTEPCLERDARRIQHKQHWWWTANYVFDGEGSSDKSIIIFLEEDNYVLPDLLHILERTKSVLSYLPTVNVMSFGGPHPEHLDYDLLDIGSWTPLYDNGLAFNLTTWKKISARSSFYCLYDDCRWNHSLASVFENFSSGFAEMAASSVPRVLSTRRFSSGQRGAHWAWFTTQRAPLFPPLMRASVTVGERGRVSRSWRPGPRGGGGCGDLRDQILCLDPLKNATTKATTLPNQ